jgi:hypothetical protein
MNGNWPQLYIGRPYEHGARGPKAFDCWGLIWFVYQRHFGISLPELPGITTAGALACAKAIRLAIEEEWIETTCPFDGCAVAMGQTDYCFYHVGLYTSADGGLIVHALGKPAGVVADTLKRIRLSGFRTIKFFRHPLWPSS